MVGLTWFVHIAFAGSPHTGIPVHGIPGLGEPSFQTVETGWTAMVDGGFVGVFVGADAVEAQQWVDHKATQLAIYKPKRNPNFIEHTDVDFALGDGIGLLIFRDENVAVMCRHRTDARSWAIQLHESITGEAHPPLEPPKLTQKGEVWVPVLGENTIHFSFVGGAPTASPETQFSAPPERMIAWDQWGRTSVTNLETE